MLQLPKYLDLTPLLLCIRGKKYTSPAPSRLQTYASLFHIKLNKNSPSESNQPQPPIFSAIMRMAPASTKTFYVSHFEYIMMLRTQGENDFQRNLKKMKQQNTIHTH